MANNVWYDLTNEKEEYIKEQIARAQQAIGTGLDGGYGYGTQQATNNRIGSTIVQSPQVMRKNAGPVPVVEAKAEKDVLLWKDRPLPEDWRGAEYREWRRDVFDGCWRLRFKSPWTTTEITVLLDMETNSGADVNKMAGTFLEVINQRRLG